MERKSRSVLLVLLGLICAVVSLAAGQPEHLKITPIHAAGAHPRLWTTPARMARMRADAAANTARYQKVKSQADEGLNTTGQLDWAQMNSLSIVYQMTGDRKYADRAVASAVGIATQVPTNHISADSYFYMRVYEPSLAFVYDWCFDTMTTTQKQQLATYIMDRADEVWPDTNPDPGRANGWAVNLPSDNYYYGFLMTWPAALALLDDGTDTGVGPISGTNRPLYHVNLAKQKFLKQVHSYTDGWGKGGAFWESTNYDSIASLALQLEAHRSITGEDLFNQAGFDFMNDSVFWRIYSASPDGIFHWHNGDQPSGYGATLNEFDRKRALVVMANISDETKKQYLKYWLDNIAPQGGRNDSTWEFIYYDSSQPARDYRQDLPLSYWAPGSQILIKRSSWATDATWWGIWAGRLYSGHQDRDVNGFQIWKGGWLVGNGSLWSDDGTLAATSNFNNFTFGGDSGAQIWPELPAAEGNTIRHEFGSDYTYFVGQAAPDYNRNALVVNDYVRKFVSLNNDSTFVVYDRVTVPNPATAKRWQLFSRGPITVSGRKYQFDNGAFQLSGINLLPQSAAIDVTDMHQVYDPNVISSRRLNITNNGNATDYFLNVFQLTPVGQSVVGTPLTVTASSGNAQGTEVAGQLVLFGKSEEVDDIVAYSITNDTTKQYLFDLKPGTIYNVAARDSNGNARNFTVDSNSQGSLNFTTLAGERSFTVTPAGDAPKVIISITLAGQPDTVRPGDTISYTMSYINNGTATGSSVQVTDPIPDGSTYVPGSASNGGTLENGVLTWNVGSLAPGISGTQTFQVTAN